MRLPSALSIFDFWIGLFVARLSQSRKLGWDNRATLTPRLSLDGAPAFQVDAANSPGESKKVRDITACDEIFSTVIESRPVPT
jgi:hypothetical protein